MSGDHLLVVLTERLHRFFGNAPMTRIHGSQFLVMTHLGDLEQLIAKVRQSFQAAEPRVTMVLKAGIYETVPSDRDVMVMRSRAHIACESIYQRFDVDTIWFAPSMESERNFVAHLVNHFDEALAQEWIELYYQPLVRVSTGKVSSFEALVRWRDPAYGVLPGGKVIPILEDAHLIAKLDLYVIEHVCRDLQQLKEQSGVTVARTSINLSCLDLEEGHFAEKVEAIRKKYDVPRSLLRFEITESALFFSARPCRSRAPWHAARGRTRSSRWRRRRSRSTAASSTASTCRRLRAIRPRRS